jgi:hypothetical protein
MPSPSKSRSTATPPAKPAAQPGGTFARLRARAEKKTVKAKPYVIDDLDPPMTIPAPTSLEQQAGLAALFSNTGEFRTRDARQVLQLIADDQFEALWAATRRKHITFFVELIRDMGEHWGGFLRDWSDLGDAEDDLGGSPASSN